MALMHEVVGSRAAQGVSAGVLDCGQEARGIGQAEFPKTPMHGTKSHEVIPLMLIISNSFTVACTFKTENCSGRCNATE